MPDRRPTAERGLDLVQQVVDGVLVVAALPDGRLPEDDVVHLVGRDVGRPSRRHGVQRVGRAGQERVDLGGAVPRRPQPGRPSATARRAAPVIGGIRRR